jgi:urea transport system ATP-binding protein
MIEKFATTRGEAPSEFLDLNHTSKLMILVSLLIPQFARDASIKVDANFGIGTLEDQEGAMLKVEGVELKYGAAQVLRGVELEAHKGEVMSLMGRNGVGKTTLLRAIVGHHPVSAGTITWNGEALAGMPPYERARRGIAIVPQGREIFPLLTVAENLQTGLAPLSKGERQIDDEIFTLFPVLKSMLRRRGGDLSGGQQQQLAIGRALVMKPSLLVLDEPTEGIQPSIIKDIGRAIDYLRKKGEMAILLVEQYFEFARDLADRYAVMDRGQVVLSGKRAEMVESDVLRRLSV